MDPALTCTASHDEMARAVDVLVRGPFGAWIRDILVAHPRPDLVGLSVLYSGQVLAGLTVTAIARELWPGVAVVWGGPHVTALRDAIVRDAGFGSFVDAFVFGYAEKTFVELLDAIANRAPWPSACVRAGSGAIVAAVADPSAIPVFDDLSPYRHSRLTLPAQATRGCVFGRCRTCTYPRIEGTPTKLGEVSWRSVLRRAEREKAIVSFKDALADQKTLEKIARVNAGGVRWSACTKMTVGLPKRFRRLADAGLDTVEIGLESLCPNSQQLIGKILSEGLFLATLDATGSAGIGLVVNYMLGLPGENSAEALKYLDRLHRILDDARRTGARVLLEENHFQLERLAPVAASNLVEITGSWPWASVLRWRAREDGDGR